ncbi:MULTISPECIES: type III secretion system translocon subunit SctE [unclassified Pseudomonas]|uniref:type III secretion system translocon subunit SctE n=1 Tax=unclassified Pseudomonas TaxID=196821 RepID=UPI0024476805|nr:MULTISPECIES: type III secretion system translocon subunit SctE [unclassified Pseudomonas]MDH0301281.1 NAD synthetase [Pseudomonas sp. GD04091]MDH1984649.1 NAD synthetase [Pseudomonas sp. GD03689]
MARQRLQGRIDQQKLFKAIDADPGIVGAGVVYIDADYNVMTLREFQPICSIKPKRIILREAPRYTSPEQFMNQLQTNPREARVVKEAVNTTLSCAGAVLGWIVMFSGTIAVPFSGGASLALTVAGYAAATASTAQCGIGLVRTAFEATDPSLNDAMDQEAWYQAATPVLDAVSLMGVGASGLTTLKFLQVRKAATGTSWYQLTRSLSRQQRKALTTELLTIKHPALTAKQLKLRQSAGELVKRYTPTQISHSTQTLIKDSVGGFIGLSGSGTVQGLAVGLYEELSE